MIDAGLVIPVYRSGDGELHLVMILRQPGGVHGGQVAFPGGKRDPEDETMLDTALREVREELGLTIDRADVLAELPVVEPEPQAIACSHTWRASTCRSNGRSPSVRSRRFSTLN